MVEFLLITDTIVLTIVVLVLWSFIGQMNLLRVRLDRIERARGLSDTQRWEAWIKAGSRTVVRILEAGSEGDALRQLLVDGYNPKHITSLKLVGAPDGPFRPPAA